MYSNIEQLIPSDTLPQLSYEDINLELAQLDNSYFSQQLSDYIQYSYPSSNYTSSPEYYHSYSSSTPPTPPPPLEIKTEPTRKATKPKKYDRTQLNWFIISNICDAVTKFIPEFISSSSLSSEFVSE